MKLILDIGNTMVKAGVFEKKQMIANIHSPELTIEFLKNIIKNYSEISSVIFSSVRDISPGVYDFLKEHFHVIGFSASTPVPIVNLYKTPGTLGKDRLAGVVASHSLYPDENVLVIDAGTCITYDMISAKGEYYGGSISPGLSMRFKALYTFTGKLPLVSFINFNELVGTDTEKSILSGVINGIVGETDFMIEKYKALYSPLKTFICGGDAAFLANRLKSSTFAVPELVLIGLNEILDYNE